jgi:hypothetical protein
LHDLFAQAELLKLQKSGRFPDEPVTIFLGEKKFLYVPLPLFAKAVNACESYSQSNSHTR